MKFRIIWLAGICGISLSVCFVGGIAKGDSDDRPLTTTNSPAATGPHYGILNWLDPRSAYQQEFFPQPLLVDDTGLEDTEFEVSYLHTKANDQHSDAMAAGGQTSFGLLTVELTVPYEQAGDSDDSSKGIGDVNLEARYPLYQFVSPGGFFDTTVGTALEVGIPVNSAVSKNAELDPEIFNDLRLGQHFSLQTVLGYDTLFGGGDEGGVQTFEYGLVFGYSVPRKDVPLPGIKQISPLFELSGETGLNKGEAGQNSVLGSAGFRLDFKPIGEMAPSIGVGYVFPIDSGAREEVHWGIAASFELEF